MQNVFLLWIFKSCAYMYMWPVEVLLLVFVVVDDD